MQVGPTMTATIPNFTHDLRSYAVQPVTFLEQYFTSHGAEATRDFVTRVRIYPFISDLFGEWLARNSASSPSELRHALVTIDRAVIGNMTVEELAEMLKGSLKLASDQGNMIATHDVATTLREFQLSSLADRVTRHGTKANLTSIEQLLSEEPAIPEPVTPDPVEYDSFLSELKDAGVVIPSSAKGGSADKARLRNAKSVKPQPAALTSLLSPDAKNEILSDVFGRDETDFKRTAELIDKAKEWKQASIYLDALFMRRNVDPNTRAAARLSDAVYARFNSLK